MAKLPYMQFYPSDWLADCQVLSLAARGAWQTIICKAWHPAHAGVLEMNRVAMARLLGSSAEEAETVLDELDAEGIAEVEKTPAGYRITCRRIVRDWAKAYEKGEKLRQAGKRGAAKRWKGGDGHPNGHPNGVATPTLMASQKLEARCTVQPSGTTRSAHEIPTLEAVTALAGKTAFPLTEEIADAYWHDREAVGWIKRDQPITNWRADLQRYASHWHENHKSEKTNGRTRQRPTEAPHGRSGASRPQNGAGAGIEVSKL